MKQKFTFKRTRKIYLVILLMFGIIELFLMLSTNNIIVKIIVSIFAGIMFGEAFILFLLGSLMDLQEQITNVWKKAYLELNEKVKQLGKKMQRK